MFGPGLDSPLDRLETPPEISQNHAIPSAVGGNTDISVPRGSITAVASSLAHNVTSVTPKIKSILLASSPDSAPAVNGLNAASDRPQATPGPSPDYTTTSFGAGKNTEKSSQDPSFHSTPDGTSAVPLPTPTLSPTSSTITPATNGPSNISKNIEQSTPYGPDTADFGGLLGRRPSLAPNVDSHSLELASGLPTPPADPLPTSRSSSTTSTRAPTPSIQGLETARAIVAASRRVLLLLDIQKAMLSDDEIGVPSSDTVHSNLWAILSCAREAKPPPLIIHVRNTGDDGEPDEPHAPGWQLIFAPAPGEIVIDKRKNNAFVGTMLGDVIPETAEIVVAGFQTDFSVRATCIAARDRGNEVLLIRGGHATKNRIEVMHGGRIMPAQWIELQVEAEMEDIEVHVLEMRDLPNIFTDR